MILSLFDVLWYQNYICKSIQQIYWSAVNSDQKKMPNQITHFSGNPYLMTPEPWVIHSATFHKGTYIMYINIHFIIWPNQGTVLITCNILLQIWKYNRRIFPEKLALCLFDLL